MTSSGQILVAGTFFVSGETASEAEGIVARFNANGTLDTTYGTNGEVIIGPSGVTVGGSTFNGLESPRMAIGSDGSVVFTGSVSTSSTLTELAVGRLTPQGAVDTTFGTDGLVTISGDLPAGSAVALQPNGQILVAGAVYIGPGPLQYEVDIYRLNTDGSLDTSLGESGIQAAGFTAITQILVQSNGQILVDGYSLPNFPGGHPSGVLARLNTDGSLEAQAPASAVEYAPDGGGLAVQSNGDIVINGIIRLTPNLTADATFGTGGFARMVPGTFSNVAIAPDGSYVAVGSINSYSNGLVADVTSTGTSARQGDFTGDGIADPAFYLAGTSTFVIGNSSGGAGQVIQLGVPGVGNTIPAPGNYFATGQEDVAAYVATTGTWEIRNPTDSSVLSFSFGQAGVGATIPAPGDYYGTGADDVAIYLTQSATWGILNPGLQPGVSFHFGVPGAGNTIPVPGDYFGTGADDVAVYLPQSGQWSILTPGLKSVLTVNFGIPGVGNTIPVPGAYDGTGVTNLAVYLPSLGELQYISSSGQVITVPFGLSGAGQTLPEPGDFTGDGVTDLAAYFPSSNEFIAQQIGASPTLAFTVGFTDQGSILPVTSVVSQALLGSGIRTPGVSMESVGSGVMGEADALDFLMPIASDAKKSKPDGLTAD